MNKPSILKPPFTPKFKAAWSVLALTACLSIGSAQAADQGARHHAKGEYDTVTAIYEVVEGDELIVIGERFQVPLDTLKAENNLSSDFDQARSEADHHDGRADCLSPCISPCISSAKTTGARRR